MAISWFTERFPPKVRKAIDVLGLVLLAILNLVIFWYSLRWIDITGSRMISVLHVPRWTAQIAIPIGTGVSAVFCFIKLWLGLRGDEELGVPWMRDD
jgi:TRAP-type C4-dicarboxylate transport system permease small subunit